MIAMQAVPINRPPSSSCTLGTGNLSTSIGIAGHLFSNTGPVVDDARRDRMELVEFFLESADEFQSHAVHRQTGHERETAVGSLLAEENAKSFRVAFDSVEQQRGNGAAALAINQLGHGRRFPDSNRRR